MVDVDCVRAKQKIFQPHDKLIKKILSNKAVAADIFNLYLPSDILKKIDLDHLELQRDSFIDDEHKTFTVDLLYKTTFENREGYIWILLEHQSSEDPWLPVRIFKYISLIWEHLRKNSTKIKIPLVYPLVIYNGVNRYKSTMNLRDLIEPEESQTLFDNLFQKPFHLVDLTQIENKTLREKVQEHVRGVSILLTLKNIFHKNLQSIFESELVAIYKKLDKRGNRDDVSDMLYYLLNEGRFLSKEQFWTILNQEFSPEVEGKVMTIAQQLRAEGFEKGIEKGIEKGKCLTAKRLLEANADLAFIVEITGLPIIKIKELQKN